MGAGSLPEENVGATDVAGTAGLPLAGGEVLEKLDGTFRCLLLSQSIWLVIQISQIS